MSIPVSPVRDCSPRATTRIDPVITMSDCSSRATTHTDITIDSDDGICPVCKRACGMFDCRPRLIRSGEVLATGTMLRWPALERVNKTNYCVARKGLFSCLCGSSPCSASAVEEAEPTDIDES